MTSSQQHQRSAIQPPASVLAVFNIAPDSLERASSGLINLTWHVRSSAGTPLILQRLNPLFPAEINTRIDVVTQHLAARGLATPRVVPTQDGALWYEAGSEIWRVLTEIDGVTRDAIETPEQAAEAGRILGAFHRGVADLQWSFGDVGSRAHDTPAHLAALRAALKDQADHSDHATIAKLAVQILKRAEALPPLPAAAPRTVHGDPKISNIMFERGSDQAICLVDLDTLKQVPVMLELGDAFRSWCLPGPEDSPTAIFSAALFSAAVRGYATETRRLLTEAEWSHLVDATLTITLELAARFCADALQESYFGWDAGSFASASAHNQARARCQLMLATSIEAQRPVLQAILEAAFDPHYIA